MDHEFGAEGQQSESDGAWAMLSDLLPFADVTASALRGELSPAVPRFNMTGGEDPFDVAQRALYRSRRRHLLITGLRGVGKSQFVMELARRAADDEIPFLRGKRFLWVDCSNVGPEDSRPCLESLLIAGAGDCDTVLCIDGFQALLKRASGGTNKPLVRAASARPGLQIIGVMPKWEFSDLIGGDAEMLDLFTRIEIDEPSEDDAIIIALAKKGTQLIDFAGGCR